MKACKKYPAGLISIILICFFLPFSAAADELDLTFGIDGKVATAIGNYEDYAFAVTLQQDDKILAGGSSSNGADLDFAIARYNPDGTLDRSFNFDGMLTTQVGYGDDEIAALAVQDDGYIVAAGYSMADGSRDFALVRYTPAGQRDSSFGLDGIVVTEYATLDDEITAMAIDENGRIVVAGYSTGTAGRAIVVGRYLPNGELDNTFGTGGLSLTGVGDDSLVRSIDLDDEGRIIVAGSYFHDDRTEVMVLRFTDAGRLDSGFGVEGLGLSGYIQDSTEGFAVKVHESGEILVGGSVGGPGDYDAVLFKFTEDGLPGGGFGNNGMLEIEASLEDDMVLAIDVKDDVVYLSGFTTVDDARQFLFISLQFSSPERVEVPEIDSVPFLLKTGSASTGLNIGRRQVSDSYDEYFADEENGIALMQTTIDQARFSNFSNDTSYAIAVQPDGRAIAAGISEENGVASFAVARFAEGISVTAQNAMFQETSPDWLATKTPFEVSRSGAISGGIISANEFTIVQRGVVFSIAPDPVLKTAEGGNGGNGNGNGNGTDTDPPVIISATAIVNVALTRTTLSVTTDEPASCGFSLTPGTPFQNMDTLVPTADNLTHTRDITPLVIGTSSVFIKCRDTNNNETVERVVPVTSETISQNPDIPGIEKIAAGIGGFIVGTAHAQTGDTPVRSVFDTSTSYDEEGFTEDGSGVGRYSSIIKNLKPGTTYYVRAYAVTGSDIVFYGNQETFKTADSCFIATAAYGSFMHAHVQLLRSFRDQYLVTNVPGRMFVELYYRYSPPIADVIAGSPALREIVRLLLLPLVGMSWLVLQLGGAGLLFVFSLFILPYLIYQRTWQKE
ncbi:MAG: delta-60 repeat domain-containing protein [Desulfobulbaceae bacterium]|nr:delta-60 repeat domain-containing protein [Desulfobulbaceae bacterium]